MKRVQVLAAMVLLVFLAIPYAATDAQTTTTAPLALNRVTIASVGLSVGYPASWTVTQSKGLSKAALNVLKKLNPKLASATSGAEVNAAMKNAKFYAINVTEAPFGSNVSVSPVESGGFPSGMSDFRQGVVDEFKSSGVTLQSTSSKKVGGKTSYLAVLLASLGNQGVHVEQLYVPRGNGAVLVTVTTRDDPTQNATVDAIIVSVRTAHH